MLSLVAFDESPNTGEKMLKPVASPEKLITIKCHEKNFHRKISIEKKIFMKKNLYEKKNFMKKIFLRKKFL